MINIKKETKDDKIALVITVITFLVLTIIGAYLYFYTNFETAKKNYPLAKDEYRNSRLENAQKLLEKTTPPKEIAVDYYELLLNTYFNQNKLEQSKEICKKLIKINPDKKDLYYYIVALIYYNYGENENCINYLKKAIEADNSNIHYKFYLGNVYANIEDYDKAIEKYSEVIKQNSNYESAWASLAGIYESKKDYKKALEYRVQAANKFKNNVYHTYYLAKLYEKLNDKENAIKYYAQTIDNDVLQESDAKSKYFQLKGKPYKQSKNFKTITVPITEKNGLYYATINMENAKAKFLIDTGANHCVIYKSYLDKHSIKYSKETKTTTTLADGSVAVAYLSVVDFYIGDGMLPNTMFAIIDDSKNKQDFDGILGNNVLQKTDYYIDSSAKKMILKVPQTNP